MFLLGSAPYYSNLGLDIHGNQWGEPACAVKGPIFFFHLGRRARGGRGLLDISQLKLPLNNGGSSV